MEKITILIAQGGNDLQIPCRIMKDVEEARDFCKGLELEPIGDSGMRYGLPDLDDNLELAEKIFTSYYGGCGGAYIIIIKEVKFNEALVNWDLD